MNYSMYLILLLAFIVVFIYFIKVGYGRKALMYSFFSFPFIYFSINMIDEAVTIDEWDYIYVFRLMNTIERGSLYWFKGTYQYRISQIFSGTMCTIARGLLKSISDNQMILIYKYSHWLLFFVTVVSISFIWTQILNGDPKKLKGRIACSAILYGLIGLPISCLLLKVCNYDAGCVYFGVAGISLLILAERRKSIKFAWASVFVSLLSCLEKWGGLPYWCICVSGIGALVFRYSKSWAKSVASIFLSVFGSSIMCYLALVYIRLLEGQGLVDLNIGAALFPIFFMAKLFFGYSSINFNDITFYDSSVLVYLPIVLIAIIIFSLILETGRKFYCRWCYTNWFKYISLIYVVTLFLGSILASYLVIRSQYPFIEIPEGYYVPSESMNGTIYFYNVKTHIGYILCQIFYSFSVVLTNMPTIYLVGVFVACYIIFKHNRKWGGQNMRSIFYI